MGKRVIWIVLDSAGAGALPDAEDYKDAGADTLGHIIGAYPDIRLDNMRSLGLFNIEGTSFFKPYENVVGCYGKAKEMSRGKDTTRENGL